ncbi:MAG: NUDIX domain-containing protein [Patescibacteria group bacterium]
MKFEFSAGGIVLRPIRQAQGRQAQAFGSEAQARRDFGSKPQFSKKGIEILVAQHSQHHGWVFPKGLIGDHPSANSAGSLQAGSGQARETKSASAKGFGETKEEAALREVEEETGIKGKIIKPLEPVTYWYNFEGEKIKKTVYYFLMGFVEGDTKNHDWEMENVEWLPIDEVEKRLTYKSDKEVWQETRKIIEKLI